MRAVVDFDGIICDEDTWELIPRSKSMMQKLREEGWHITIWTANNVERYNEILGFLIAHEIPYDEILLDKPRATIYIDDRAVSNWDSVELTLETWKEIGKNE
jgi:hypothetical protein